MAHPRIGDDTRGLLLGVVGVTIFALTLPMTRLATGGLGEPQLSPWFVTFGRAALAGLLSVLYLLAVRAPWPSAAQWRGLAGTALGVVVGFPLLMAYGVQQVGAVHASVILGVLPLGTAVVAAIAYRQRPSPAFWGCAALGSALVVFYAVLKARAAGVGMAVHWADVLLFGAVVSAALGYVGGAKLTPQLGAERVICWVLVLSLPVTLPVTFLTWPAQPVSLPAWGGFLYVAVFSMWIGFFAWYRALALGGAVRVSQVQLLQPFLSMLSAVPLLGERLDALTLVFGVAVVASVFLGKRAPADRRPA